MTAEESFSGTLSLFIGDSWKMQRSMPSTAWHSVRDQRILNSKVNNWKSTSRRSFTHPGSTIRPWKKNFPVWTLSIFPALS